MCTTCQQSGELRDIVRTNHAMCRACPHAPAPGAATARCGLSGVALTVSVLAAGDRCPAGRHTTAARQGVVTWKGADWYGVPATIRIDLEAAGVKFKEPLPGCGCNKALKDAAERLGVGDQAAALANACIGLYRSVKI